MKKDFDGMLATVLPHSDLSLNSNCYRVRLHCLHRGRFLLITRASNMMPVLEEYNQPHLDFYKCDGVIDDAIGSRVVLVGLASSLQHSLFNGLLCAVSRQVDGPGRCMRLRLGR